MDARLPTDLCRCVPREATVLEIGAGYCCWINALSASRRVAVDAWPEIARHVGAGCRRRASWTSPTGLAPFADGSFDVVLASNVLEHFEPDAAATLIAEWCALLRPGGRLIVMQPNFRYA